MRRNSFLWEMRKNALLYSMVLPTFVFFMVFAYVPMFGIIVAFKNYNFRGGILFSPWAGLENFKYFFLSGKAWLVTRNTIQYNLLFLIANNLVGILIAIFLAEVNGRLFKKISQTFLFLPYFISWVVVASLVHNLFSTQTGLVNNTLKSVGMHTFDLYGTPALWVLYMPIFYVWKWCGFATVLYLSSIMGMDQDCYEAADIDGANGFQKVGYITLPLLRSTIIILVLLGLSRVLRGEFDMFYQLIGMNPTLFDSTDIIDTLVFRSLVGTYDLGMASSAGFYQSVLCFVVIIVVNYGVRRYERDYALF